MNPVFYDVFAPLSAAGGKRVAVFGKMPEEAQADFQTAEFQALAAASGAPLSVFLLDSNATALNVRVFTPTKEKGESDSASVAALTFTAQQAELLDVVEVQTGKSRTTAQLCGGEWLLQQGVVTVEALGELEQTAANAALSGVQLGAAHIAGTGRPNLVAEVADLAVLDSYIPDATQIRLLGEQTQTTGLILYTLQALQDGPQRRADVCFRAFGPLKGFLEDAASSNMFACLTGVLLQRGLLHQENGPGNNQIRAAQRMPGQPATLTAQFDGPDDAIWVGGKASTADTPAG